MQIRKFKYVCFSSISVLIFFISSCFEKPLSPVFPEWDIVLNIPVLKNYTLEELTKKDTVFTFSNTSDSMILYSNSLRINPFNPSDKNFLNLQTKTESGKIQLSEIRFQPNQFYDFSYSINQIFPNLILGNSMVIPATGNMQKNDESVLTSFQEFRLDSGKMILTISNRFPVDLKYDYIRIFNNTNENKTEIGVITNRTVSAGGTVVDSSINLAGKKVLNKIRIEMQISTPGSNGRIVYLSPADMVNLKVQFSTFKLRSAIATFSSQYYSVINSASLDVSTGDFNINNSKLKSGKLIVNIRNNTSLGANLKITFPEIKKNNSTYIIKDIYLAPNQKLNERIYDLTSFSIYPIDGKEFSSVTEIFTVNTGSNLINLSGSDSISYDFRLEDISLESINGKALSIISRSFDLPSKDIEKYFDGSIDFSSVNINIRLNNGTNLPISLKNSILKAYNKNTGGYETLPVKNTEIQPKSSSKIELDPVQTTDFFNKFSKNNIFPKTIEFSGEAGISTHNQNYFFSPADTIGGEVNISIPLKVALKNVVYRDTFNLSFTADDKKQISKVNSGQIKLNVTSYVPVNINILIFFYGTVSNPVLSLPRANEPQYYISAAVTNSGNVTDPKSSEFIVELSKDDIEIIKDCIYGEFKIQMNTPPGPNVSFRKNDMVKIKMFTIFGYRISSK